MDKKSIKIKYQNNKMLFIYQIKIKIKMKSHPNKIRNIFNVDEELTFHTID